MSVLHLDPWMGGDQVGKVRLPLVIDESQAVKDDGVVLERLEEQ
jgi:hypothetical protein